MAATNLIISVIILVMSTFKADVTACHKWPAKTTIILNKTHIQHNINTTSALLNWFMRFC